MNTAEKSKRYVLVLDSNAEDLFYTSMLLQRFGYYTFTTHTAQEAIGYMTAAKPSAVVADAGSGGTTLLSWMTKDPRFLDVPLILLSPLSSADSEARARREEYAAHLGKPLKVEEFYRAIQTVIEKGSRRNLRIATHLNVRLDDGPRVSEGFATELSEYGMFFRTLEPRQVHSRIPVVLEIKGRQIKLEAVVLYTARFEEGSFREHGMGLKFMNIGSEDREVIAAYMLEQLEEGLVRQRG
ncbi:MAG: PilZ domain-containing protein [Nitrospirota bacterium]